LREMNTLIKRISLSVVTLSLALAVAMPMSTEAQPAAADSVVVQLQIEHGNIAGSPLDATLRNVVNFLQKHTQNLNIVLPADLGDVKVGDLTLRDAPPDLALQALSVASGNQFVVENRRSGENGNHLFVIERPQPSYRAPDVVVEAFSLHGYLSYMDFDMTSRQVMNGTPDDSDKKAKKLDEMLEKLEAIIRSTVERQQALGASINGVNTPVGTLAPEINYYKEAELVVVIGMPAAVDTARTIINALPGQNQAHFGGGGGPGGGMGHKPPDPQTNHP
jgi:hypothetical protein